MKILLRIAITSLLLCFALGGCNQFTSVPDGFEQVAGNYTEVFGKCMATNSSEDPEQIEGQEEEWIMRAQSACKCEAAYVGAIVNTEYVDVYKSGCQAARHVGWFNKTNVHSTGGVLMPRLGGEGGSASASGGGTVTIDPPFEQGVSGSGNSTAGADGQAVIQMPVTYANGAHGGITIKGPKPEPVPTKADFMGACAFASLAGDSTTAEGDVETLCECAYVKVASDGYFTAKNFRDSKAACENEAVNSTLFE